MDMLKLNLRNAFSIHQERTIVFEIPTKVGSVHMCFGESLEAKFIVLLNPKKYLEMWKSSLCFTHREIAWHSKEEWISSFKYQDIDEQMKNSKSKPVYLIEIGAAENVIKTFTIPILKIPLRKQLVSFVFKDGITRSTWLLVNNASFIPVVAYDERSAKIMCDYGGFMDSQVYQYRYLKSFT